MKDLKIGFVGQGFIGKNMADDFEERSFKTVRYSLDSEYVGNKDLIAECDIVFFALPTPTTPEGFDYSILKKEVGLVGKGKIAVIKSTVLPGTTEKIQKEHGDIFVLHSPEFLVASEARESARHPERNLVGVPVENKEYQEKAEKVLEVLPKAPYEKILLSKETELIKYIGNCFLYNKVVFMNMMYDLAKSIGADWTKVAEAVSGDSRIGKSHMNPAHASLEGKTRVGRGAGGYCFIKDFEAFFGFCIEKNLDPKSMRVLESIRDKNIDLLLSTQKDLDLLQGVYGESIIKNKSD